jgi:hypothetical protein
MNMLGSGYLRPWQTVAVWFLMVIVYIGLAMFEEHYLGSKYQGVWLDYRRHVGFLIPLVTNKRRWFEAACSLIALTGLMLALPFSNDALRWFQ